MTRRHTSRMPPLFMGEATALAIPYVVNLGDNLLGRLDAEFNEIRHEDCTKVLEILVRVPNAEHAHLVNFKKGYVISATFGDPAPARSSFPMVCHRWRST